MRHLYTRCLAFNCLGSFNFLPFATQVLSARRTLLFNYQWFYVSIGGCSRPAHKHQTRPCLQRFKTRAQAAKPKHWAAFKITAIFRKRKQFISWLQCFWNADQLIKENSVPVISPFPGVIYIASTLIRPHDLQFTSCFSKSTSFALVDDLKKVQFH